MTWSCRPRIVGLVLSLGLTVVAGGAEPLTPSSASSPRRPSPSPSPKPTASNVATPSDDLTFRPTVVVRRGTAQGSGTIIASLDGEALVLTAAHVVSGKEGTPEVEMHRYNLGRERTSRFDGEWPRTLAAEVAAMDRSADLAILRIGPIARLPYVALLDNGVKEPARGTVVTSVGIDLGEHLSSWLAHVDGVDWFLLDRQTEERPFLLTTRSPEHGRSGGGLFLSDGRLVGVCIGRTEEPKRRRVGIFASIASVRHLLREHDLEETVGRSDALVRETAARRTRATATSPPLSSPARPLVPTEARRPRRANGP